MRNVPMQNLLSFRFENVGEMVQITRKANCIEQK